MNKKALRDLLILLGIIIIAAIGARYLGSGETLSDYAKKNPEAAGVLNEAGSYSGTDSSESGKESGSSSGGSVLESSGQALSPVAQSESSEATENSSKEKGVSDSADRSTITPQNSSTNSTTATASSSPASGTTAAASSSPSEDTDSSPVSVSTTSTERTTYMDGFYYEPISNDIFRRISGISYPVDCKVSLDDLRYLSLLYNDFNGDTRTGELICNKDIAQDVIEIFYELYKSGYQIESVKLIDEFGGDDTASMLANNTSCFNYRVVAGTTRLSNHARGLAIDINPFYNPYITYNKDGSVNISPAGSEAYADRSSSFPYKIDDNDLACKLFKSRGFTWGGDWNSVKDYQHFERPQ